MTRTDQCSISAFDDLLKSGEIGKKQAMYLACFAFFGPMTHKQAIRVISARFGAVCAAYDGRITELEEMGFLEKHDKVTCEFTGKTVNRWIWTGRTTPFESKLEWVQCPNCQGKGGKTRRVYCRNGQENGDLFDGART